jgi:hypothetical protein
VEQRDLTQSGAQGCRGWVGRGLPELGGFGLHRA